ncbi:hypothetical protein [Sulfuricurvum sp.]|uniref:hypothetical protein n=1 Tax=Sulfuricurvum sp. TaxID=2025608 RepID=UPI0035615FEC
MADCIDALITANIKSVLQTVSVANGYNTNLGTVEEKRSEFNSCAAADTFTLLVKLPPEYDEDYQHTEIGSLEFLILYFNGKDDSKGNDPIQYTDRNVGADIQRALMVDRTRGGYALNTKVTGLGHNMFYQPSPQGSDVGTIATWFLVQILRRIDADDPYQI